MIFSAVPGIEIMERNVVDIPGAAEIDVGVFSSGNRNGLYFLPNIFLVECKNWYQPVGSAEVVHFCHKLEARNCGFGILVAANGITGNVEDLSNAHRTISEYLANGTECVCVRLSDLEAMRYSEQLVLLLKKKLVELKLRGANS
jgi:hypothetical protein